MKSNLLLIAFALASLVGCVQPPPRDPTLVFHADVHFTPDERSCITESAEQWRVQTNGVADTQIVFDYDPASHFSVGKHLLSDKMVRWLSWMDEVQQADARAGGTILGQCRGDIHDSDDWAPIEIRLVTDRFQDHHVCKLTTIHEMGHAYGLDHLPFDPGAIMFPSINRSSKECLTSADLGEFCKHNDCGGILLKGCE